VYAVNEGTPSQSGSFWIHIELAENAIFSKLWNEGAPEPSRMASYPTASSNATRPWVAIAPILGDYAVLPSHGEVAASQTSHPHGAEGPEDITAPLVFLRRGEEASKAFAKPDELVKIVQSCKNSVLDFRFPSLKGGGGNDEGSATHSAAEHAQKVMAEKMGGSIAVLRYPAIFSNCIDSMVDALATAGAQAVMIIAPEVGSDADFFLRQAAPLGPQRVPVIFLRSEVGPALEGGLCSADGSGDEEGGGPGLKRDEGVLWSACRGKGGDAGGVGAEIVHATVSWGATQNKQEDEEAEGEGEEGSVDAPNEAKLVPWPRSWREQIEGSSRVGDEPYPLPGGVRGAKAKDLSIVVYRDDPPQSYSFKRMTLRLELGGGGAAEGGGRKEQNKTLQEHVDMNGRSVPDSIASLDQTQAAAAAAAVAAGAGS
jgi:hypothetical protein